MHNSLRENVMTTSYALCSAAAFVALHIGSQAMAQDPEDPGQVSAVLEEITVTARRQTESLQAVPIAITAVSNEDIRRFDIRSATDLQRIVPSLTATGRLGQNEESLTLRGQRATGEFIGAGAGPAVVSYFAEVPSASNGPGLYLDLANVQVLKGPQGTFFGRNTTGGAVLYEPMRPENGFSGHVHATGGDLGRRDLEAVVNLPVIDDVLLLRVAAQQQQRDGLSVDVNTGTEFNNRNNRTGRISVLFNPSDRVSNYFVYQTVDFEENGPASVLFAINPGAPLYPLLEPIFAAQQARSIREVALGVHGPESRNTDLILNRTELDLGRRVTLTNIASYTRERANRTADIDGTPLPITDSLGVTGYGSGYNPNHSILTEELQLSGTSGDGSLAWRFGGYTERLRTEGAQTFSQRLFLGVTSHQLDGPQSVDSEAVFGHINLDLGAHATSLAGLNLSAGYRHTRDAGSLGFDLLLYPGQLFELDELPAPSPGVPCFTFTATGAVHPNCLVVVDGSDDGESWNLGLDYQMSNATLVYGSLRRGYKSGGFNPGVGVFHGTEVPDFAFGPEEVDALELGVKANWSLGAIDGRTNLALYKSWYNDVQVLNDVIIGGAATTATQNAAEAEIQGLEIEGELRLADRLGLTYGYSSTDAEYITYITPAGDDLSGLAFLYTPETMFNVGLSLDIVLPSGLGTLNLFGNYSWQGDMFAGFTTVDVPGITIPSYGLANLRLDWYEAFGSGFDLSVFLNNATDEDYRIANNALYDSAGYAVTQYGEPRMWGASVRFTF